MCVCEPNQSSEMPREATFPRERAAGWGPRGGRGSPPTPIRCRPAADQRCSAAAGQQVAPKGEAPPWLPARPSRGGGVAGPPRGWARAGAGPDGSFHSAGPPSALRTRHGGEGGELPGAFDKGTPPLRRRDGRKPVGGRRAACSGREGFSRRAGAAYGSRAEIRGSVVSSVRHLEGEKGDGPCGPQGKGGRPPPPPAEAVPRPGTFGEDCPPKLACVNSLRRRT